jgi:hypothetical protein
MKAKYLLLAACLWLSLTGHAQQWDFVRTFPVEAPTAITADINGNLYLATKEGEVKSYSPEGVLLQTYSPQSASYFNSLEARSAMQLWAFDENRQQLLVLDRFLNQVSSQQLPPEVFGYASAAAPSAGNSLWVVDISDMQLKQWRTDTRQLISSFRLNLLKQPPTAVKALREYQHKLYLFSPERLYIFNRLSAYEQTLPLAEWLSFAFAENDLLLLTTNKLLRISLYSGKTEILPLPATDNYKQLLFINGTYYFFTDKNVQAYRLLP